MGEIQNLFNKLDPYFLAYNKINKDTEHYVLYLSPEELLSEKRIDIVVKYYYIKARETGENLAFAKEIYKKHIEAFSDGTFEEQGNKDKNSLEKYINTFDQLIDDIKENGFNEEISVIPIGKDHEILDGSHRVACALYFNKKIKVVQFPHLSVDYGFEFFRKRLIDEFYLDFMAKEYVNLEKKSYVLFAWPKIGTKKNMQSIEKVLNQEGCRVIYKKKITIDKAGLWNLFIKLYQDEHWIGHKGNNFKAVYNKRDWCYAEGGFLGVYIVECQSVACLAEKKQLLRDRFGVDKSSVHSTDTYEESIEILDFILDENYDQRLYDDFLKNKATKYTWKRHVMKKARYFYRNTINMIKRIIGKPT